jgi:hypothetical protein
MNIKTNSLAVLLCLSCTTLPTFAMDGLAAHWKMDEGKGVEILDASGQGSDGEIIGHATWEKDAQRPLLRFDGQTSYINIPDGLWNVQGEAITLLCLFKADELKGRIFDHRMSGANSGAYALDASGAVSGFGEIEDYSDYARNAYRLSLPVKVDEWHLAVITIEGNKVSGYLDGELQAEAEVNRYFHCTGGLSIGARGTSPDLFFSGLIREMAVFNRALSSEQIGAIQKRYDQGLPLFADIKTK